MICQIGQKAKKREDGDSCFFIIMRLCFRRILGQIQTLWAFNEALKFGINNRKGFGNRYKNNLINCCIFRGEKYWLITLRGMTQQEHIHQSILNVKKLHLTSNKMAC